MHYFGGKYRIRKEIAKIIKTIRGNYTYFEPFVGAAWILQEIKGKRIASDGCYPLISMYKALQEGWIPPDNVSEKQYKEAMLLPDIDPLKAFIGFGLSFSGKWFGGYARSGGRNYCLNAKNSLLKQLPLIQDVTFVYGDFTDHFPEGKFIYCDPPYVNTTKYSYFKGFNTELFWHTVRRWSEKNIVIVSEYCAPNDFECIAEIKTKLDMNEKYSRTERIFKRRQ